MVDAAQAWRLGRERYPHCISGVVRRDGGLALQLSHPNAASRSASELPWMELRLESRALHEAIEAT